MQSKSNVLSEWSSIFCNLSGVSPPWNTMMTPMIRFISPIYVLDLVHIYSSETEYMFWFFSCFFVWQLVCWFIVNQYISFIVIVIFNRIFFFNLSISFYFLILHFWNFFCVFSPTLSLPLHKILSCNTSTLLIAILQPAVQISIFYQGCFLLHILLKI